MKTAEEWAQEIANQAERMETRDALQFYRELEEKIVEDVTAWEVQVYNEAFPDE